MWNAVGGESAGASNIGRAKERRSAPSISVLVEQPVTDSSVPGKHNYYIINSYLSDPRPSYRPGSVRSPLICSLPAAVRIKPTCRSRGSSLKSVAVVRLKSVKTRALSIP